MDRKTATELLPSEYAILKILASMGGFVVNQEGFWRLAYSIDSALMPSESGRILHSETVPNLIERGFIQPTEKNTNVYEINTLGRQVASGRLCAP